MNRTEAMCLLLSLYLQFKVNIVTPTFYSGKLKVRLTKNSVVLKQKSILPEINFLPLFFSEKITNSSQCW